MGFGFGFRVSVRRERVVVEVSERERYRVMRRRGSSRLLSGRKKTRNSALFDLFNAFSPRSRKRARKGDPKDLVRDREKWSPFFVLFLFRGERRGRGGSRTFPTVVGGRLGKSRRWSSWTWSWPWPASRGRSGGFSACPRRGRGSEKARGESPFRGSGLRPVTLARTKSFRKNARRKPSEARVPSEKNARRADG